MVTDIEKQFFDMFGIERIQTCKVTATCNNYINYNDCNGCNAYNYPKITDSHYLKMICLIAEKLNCFTNYNIDYKNLKEYILKEMILQKDYFDNQQIQALFEEG